MKKFEYKTLVANNIDDLNILGNEGWEVCSSLAVNVLLLKKERTNTFFEELLGDEEKPVDRLRCYDWGKDMWEELIKRVENSTYVYIFISGELEKYDYVKHINVININDVKDVEEKRANFKIKYGGDDVEIWKLDYRSRILEEVKPS